MSDPKKNMFENIADAAKAGVDSLADRARAVGHDIAAKVGDEADNAKDRAEAEAARARAEAHGAEYREKMDAADHNLSQDFEQTKQDFSHAADTVKAEADKVAKKVDEKI